MGARENIYVKFHKNCESTVKIRKISCLRCHFVKFDINIFSGSHKKLSLVFLCTYQCKPRGGGGGVRARGGDLTNFKIFGSNSPGWETKGQSIVSKKTPSQGKKSKQTIL